MIKKVLVTVAWSRTIEVEIDTDKVNDESYLDSVREKATNEAEKHVLQDEEGIVTDCEDCPELME